MSTALQAGPQAGPLADTCSAVSLALGEGTAGSASTIASWVLLEHPGAWSRDARDEVFARTLGERRWAALQEVWLERQVRPLLVRRHGGARRSAGAAGAAEPVVVVGSARRTPFLETTSVAALADLDLDRLADGGDGHGEPLAGPLFLTCTNGAVDRCCALRGRPVAAALDAAHPGRVWEATHLGGCHLAGNLLVLPAGDLHGRLSPADALAVAEAAVGGRPVPAVGWRGRTTASGWAAAGQEAMRRHLGLTSPASVEVVGERLHPDHVDGPDGPEPAGCDVDMRAGDARWTAVVRTDLLGPRRSRCDGDTAPWPTPRVAALRPAPPDRPDRGPARPRGAR